MATHPLPFFFSIFYFFLSSGCKDISEAFSTDTLIKSRIFLFLGKGSIPPYSLSGFSAILFISSGKGLVLDVTDSPPLFQDSLTPLSVMSMSFSVPLQSQSPLSRSILPWRRFLQTNNASFYSNLLHFCKADWSVPLEISSQTTTICVLLLAISWILVTYSDFASFIFERYW